MRDMIKLLDKNLKYERHEIIDDEIHIWVKSKRKVLECPYCGKKSKKTHSTYRRTIQDLPISGKKVYIEITSRKMFCRNADCAHKTFAEKFEFAGAKGKKSRRLEREIVNIALFCVCQEKNPAINREKIQRLSRPKDDIIIA